MLATAHPHHLPGREHAAVSHPVRPPGGRPAAAGRGLRRAELGSAWLAEHREGGLSAAAIARRAGVHERAVARAIERAEAAEAALAVAPGRYPLRRAARDYCWLADWRSGLTHRAIARAAGVTEQSVRAGIRRAEALEAVAADDGRRGRAAPAPPRVVPIFPAAPLTPSSACPHSRPIRPGEPWYCVVCHQTGDDALA